MLPEYLMNISFSADVVTTKFRSYNQSYLHGDLTESSTPLPSTAANSSERPMVLPQPVNISVILVNFSPPTVRIHWAYNGSAIQNARLEAFQIIYKPIKSKWVLTNTANHDVSNHHELLIWTKKKTFLLFLY